MRKTVIGLFESISNAEQAMEELKLTNLDQSRIAFIQDAWTGLNEALMKMGVPLGDASLYADGVDQGDILIVLQQLSETDADRAADILNKHNVVNIRDRERRKRRGAIKGASPNDKGKPSSSYDTPLGKKDSTLIQNPQAPQFVPPELQRSLAQFRKDHPDPSKVAFIMMRFGNSPAHRNITKAIRDTLQELHVEGLRADDKDYHDDLYWNIMTYVYGCSFGIAVFDRILTQDFNPNVSYEVGYMNGLNKPVCLLKDQTLPTLHTDLVGRLYRTFDPQEPEKAIETELPKWIVDRGLG